MSTQALCLFCGSCQFDFNLVRVPPIPNDKIKYWTLAFGAAFIGRITRLKDQNPLICKEHIGRRMLNVYDHTLDMRHIPVPLSTEEIRSSFTYFHDHCYAKQSNIPQVCLNNGKPYDKNDNVTCSECGVDVPRISIEVHAESHCEKPKRGEYIGRRAYQERLAKERMRDKLMHCFPAFECFLIENQHGIRTSIRTTAEFEENVRRYNQSRLSDFQQMVEENIGYLENNNNTPQEVKQEIKEEEPDQGEYIDFDEIAALLQPEVVPNREEEKEPEEELDEQFINFDEPSDEEEEDVEDNDPDYEEEMNDPDYSISEESVTDAEEYEEGNLTDPEEGKRIQLGDNIINDEFIDKFFETNPHPTVFEILEISRDYVKKFSVIYHLMDRRRKHHGIVCQPDDNCDEIRKLLEEMGTKNDKKDSDFDENTIDLLVEEAMKLKGDGFSFSTGVAVLLSQRWGLPASYVHSKVASLRKRYITRRRSTKMMQKWEKDHKDFRSVQAAGLNSKPVCFRSYDATNARIPKETVEKLEKAYHKDSHLPAKRVAQLCRSLKLRPRTVRNWFEKRRKKRAEEKKYGNVRRHTFTQEQKDAMNEEFAINSHPTPAKYKKLAKTLNIPPTSVMGFFMNRRTEERKKMELEGVKSELDGMSKEVHEKLMEVFKSNKSVKFDDRVQLSTDLGLSYQAVTLWLERETVNARKNSRRGSKRRHEEIEESEKEDDEDMEQSEDDE